MCLAINYNNLTAVTERQEARSGRLAGKRCLRTAQSLKHSCSQSQLNPLRLRFTQAFPGFPTHPPPLFPTKTTTPSRQNQHCETCPGFAASLHFSQLHKPKWETKSTRSTSGVLVPPAGTRSACSWSPVTSSGAPPAAVCSCCPSAPS